MLKFCLSALLLALSTHIVFLPGMALGNLGQSPDENASRLDQRYEYVLLATNKTSTMQKEMAETADAGFRVVAVMGGETSFGGSEVVVVMSRDPEIPAVGRYQYKLLATSKTSTMQKELQEAGEEGYGYQGQTVFKTTFGGKETVLILERDHNDTSLHRYEYKLLATKKTSTMENELREGGDAGLKLVGLTVGSTTFGGEELVSILLRRVED
jgi:hypothetical protein